MRKSILLTFFCTIVNICLLLAQTNSVLWPNNFTDIYGIKESTINSILVQADGKIISGGWNYNNFVEEFMIFRYNPDGTLDTSFGYDGIVLTGYFGEDAAGNSLAILADGKILFAGVSCSWIFDCNLMLARYNQDGSIDTTFGNNGHVYVVPVSNENYGSPSIDIQYDGKIVTSVWMQNLLNEGIVMFRFNPDGTLDDSFGNGGKVKALNGLLAEASAHSVKCLENGKILVSGDVQVDAVTARYEEDGTLDISFGNDGFVFEDHYTWRSLEVQVDGKIVVGGYVPDASWWSNFALARYNADGSPDHSFGSDGKVMTGLPSTNIHGYCLEILSDGKLLLAGDGSYGNVLDMVIARYNANGTLDNSFGDNGIAVINPGYNKYVAHSIVIETDDRYLVGGYTRYEFDTVRNLTIRINATGDVDTTFNMNGRSIIATDSEDLATSITLVSDSLIILAGSADSTFSMVRYNLEGDEDHLFGRNGIVRVKIEGMPSSVVAQEDLKTILTGSFSLTRFRADGFQDTSFGESGTILLDSVSLKQSNVQPDGRIVVSGYTTLPDNKFIVLRFEPDGTQDIDFGSGGKTITGFGNYGDFAYSSYIQPDGKILLAGDTKVSDSTDPELDYDFALARCNADGSPDSSFGINGMVTTSLSDSIDHCNSMTVQADGKILCTGSSDDSFVLIRYEANGDIDQSFASNGIFISSEIAHYGNKVFFQYEGDLIMVLVDSNKLVRFNYGGTIDNTYISGPLVNPANNEGLYDAVTLPNNHIALAGKHYRNDFCLMIIHSGGYNMIQNKKEDIYKFIAYPNPFTTSTTLSYTLDKPSTVIISIFNHQGQLIERIKQEQPKGEQQVQWNAEGLPAGMYYFRIQAGDKVGGGKMVKMR